MSNDTLSPGPAAVVFDVEGVIAFPDEAALAAGLRAILPAWTPQRLHDLRHGAELYPLWEAYSVGRMGGDTYWGAVLQAWPEPVADGALAALRQLQAAATWAKLDEELLSIADDLRAQGIRTALLSNSCEDYEPQIQRFAGRFDLAHFSHRTGRRKPDPAAYLAVAEALGLSAAQLFFVDDKQRNVDAAAALGITAHLYQGLAALRDHLGRMGLKLASPAARP